MALIQIEGTEIHVAESLEVVLSRLVAAKDGIRAPSGAILAPSGWLTLTDAITHDEIYLQTSRLGYLRED